ncbi:hypothetical protein [Calothrix sp. 336/3]|uniref:hypothetical protein n=1 Tax=Calothrix sp. 336/3 TaxID=1337936 RepID=UPI00143CB18A|nr:hypothetical protein [Calothrix sp. 336/3]
MKMISKYLSILGIMAVTTTLSTAVNAQEAPGNSVNNYTLSGESLNGINKRSSEGDFSQFFFQKNPENITGKTEEKWQLGDSETQPGRSPNIIQIQPAPSGYDNDGVQVQFVGQ